MNKAGEFYLACYLPNRKGDSKEVNVSKNGEVNGKRSQEKR